MSTDTRVRHVRVKFYRANKGPGAEGGLTPWVWPDDGDVGKRLVEEYQGLDQTVDDWQIEQHRGPHFVEAADTTSPQQFTVAGIRTDRLPLVLPEGASSAIPLNLADRDRLLEPSYLTFFPNRIVAVVRSTQTPSHGTAARVLSKLTLVDFDLHPIPRSDIMEMIQRSDGVTSFDITVAAGSADAEATGDDPVLAGKRLVAKVAPAQNVTITMTAETRKEKRSMKSYMLQLFRQGKADGVAAARARIVDQNGRTDWVDLAETQIATGIDIETTKRLRHLTPADAQEAATAAFAELRIELTKAIQLATDES